MGYQTGPDMIFPRHYGSDQIPVFEASCKHASDCSMPRFLWLLPHVMECNDDEQSPSFVGEGGGSDLGSEA